MFPLSTVLFPGAILPLHIFEPRYRRLMEDVIAGNRSFGIVLIERGSEVGGGEVRTHVGTRVSVEGARELPDGRWAVIVLGRDRIRVVEWLEDDPYPRAVVALPDGAGDPDTCTEVSVDVDLSAPIDLALRATRRAVALLSEAGVDVGTRGQSLFDAEQPDGSRAVSPNAHRETVWQLCAHAPLATLDAQSLLEVDDDAERLERLTAMMISLAGDIQMADPA